MAKLSVTLTQEHIDLIRNFYIQSLKSRELIIRPDYEKIKDDIVNVLLKNVSKENINEIISNEGLEKLVAITANELKDIRTVPIENYTGIDTFSLYGGSSLFEDMAYILGCYDKVIPETKESPFGAQFEPETQVILENIDKYIVDNLLYIEEIIHQFCMTGVKPGKYTCLDRCRIWKYEEPKTT